MNIVCFITPGHISSNPRLVKEAIALDQAGYQIHIIFIQNMEFLIEFDFIILNNNPNWTYSILDNVNLSFYKKILKSTRTLVEKIAIFSVKKKLIPFLQKLAINKYYYWQLREAIKIKSALYIAHNLGALPVAVIAAKRNRTKCGFDAEDFHRNEISDDHTDYDVIIKKLIEDKYITQVCYLTAASPLISSAYHALYPSLNPIVINNVFEIKNQPNLMLNSSPVLKLFWFSQTIGKDRGLEDVINAMNIINNPLIELHLLGNLSNENWKYFNNLTKFKIYYYKPISGDKIFQFASKFDIGLALELNKPHNRALCLTNKLFTYLISGLTIIATNTQAQEQFITDSNNIGKTYPIGNIHLLIELINEYFNNKKLLNEYKKNAYNIAKSRYNWEIESKNFIELIEKYN